jgi:hypothetical protein
MPRDEYLFEGQKNHTTECFHNFWLPFWVSLTISLTVLKILLITILGGTVQLSDAVAACDAKNIFFSCL